MQHFHKAFCNKASPVPQTVIAFPASAQTICIAFPRRDYNISATYPQKVVTLCRLVHYQEVFGENYDGGKVERLPLGTDDDSSQEDRKLLCDAAITIT